MFGCSFEDIVEGWKVGTNSCTRLHPMYAYLGLSPKYTVNETLGRWIVDDLRSLKGVFPAIFGNCIVDSTSRLRHPSVLLVEPLQSSQRIDVALGEVARSAEKNAVRQVVDAAVRTRSVVV